MGVDHSYYRFIVQYLHQEARHSSLWRVKERQEPVRRETLTSKCEQTPEGVEERGQRRIRRRLPRRTQGRRVMAFGVET